MRDADEDRARIARDVSRETLARLDAYVALLARWQSVKNLVGTDTLAHVWNRHIADSLQLAALAPSGRWTDIGSGAGLPGLVLAILGAVGDGSTVDLVESNARKCAFLREAVRVTGAAATVHHARIEDIIDRLGTPAAVCARAVAPLDHLLDWAFPLLTKGAVGLFPKGRDAAAELTAARERWTVEADLLPSRTSPDARIVRITAIARKPHRPG